MAVRIAAGAPLSDSPPQRLFENHYYSKGPTHIGYDVARDGQRFLMTKEVSGQQANSPSLVVVLNWVEELKALMASK